MRALSGGRSGDADELPAAKRLLPGYGKRRVGWQLRNVVKLIEPRALVCGKFSLPEVKFAVCHSLCGYPLLVDSAVKRERQVAGEGRVYDVPRMTEGAEDRLIVRNKRFEIRAAIHADRGRVVPVRQADAADSRAQAEPLRVPHFQDAVEVVQVVLDARRPFELWMESVANIVALSMSLPTNATWLTLQGLLCSVLFFRAL